MKRDVKASGICMQGKGVRFLKESKGRSRLILKRNTLLNPLKPLFKRKSKKEYKAADKVFGPATKKSMKKTVSVRIETLAGTEKAINSMVNKVAVDTQQSLVDEGANYYIHLFNENGDD